LTTGDLTTGGLTTEPDANPRGRTRRHAVDGGEGLRRADAGPGQVGAQPQRDLGFGPGLDELVVADLIALLNDHVIEQHARDGFGDPKQIPHGQRGEAELAAADDPAGRQPALDSASPRSGPGATLIWPFLRSRRW
jgi:hypothetical protein